MSIYTRIMGDEINQQKFDEKDYQHFHQRLLEETEFVRSLFAQRAFDNQTRKLGYELELCLVDKKGHDPSINRPMLLAYRCYTQCPIFRGHYVRNSASV